MPLRRWIDLTTLDVAALETEQTVALIPFGATEQHGPHLPLGVDGFIVEALVQHSALAGLKAVVLPVQWLGWSPEHRSFAGTLTASPETLLAGWRSLCAGLIASGLQKYVFLNGHGGQPELLRVLARELRTEHNALAVTANWFSFGLPDVAMSLPEGERKWGIHAGAIETALMRHIAPHLVHEENAQHFQSRGETLQAEGRQLSPQGQVPWAWMAEDLNPQGAVGDARLEGGATPELGAALLHHAATELGNLIKELSTTPIDVLLRRGE